MKEINNLTKIPDLQAFTGRVTSANLHVHHGPGHLMPAKGNCYRADEKLSAVYATKNLESRIFLEAENGTLSSFLLKNFDLHYNEGHELTIYWTKQKMQNGYSYIAAVNNSTSQTFIVAQKESMVFSFSWLIALKTFLTMPAIFCKT